MKMYLRHKGLNVIDVKELIALEYLDFEGEYRNYVEKHNFCELCYVEKGEITLRLEHDCLTLQQYEIAVIEPDTVHSYYSANGNQNKVFVVCFECPSHLIRVMSGTKFSPNEVHSDCMRKIIEECGNVFCINERGLLEVLSSPSFGGQQAIILQLEYLLIGLLRQFFSVGNTDVVFLNREKFYSDLVDIIKGYLKSNLDRRLTLDDICKRFNYSYSFICKIFRNQTGESVIAYFNRLKMEEARRLLSETDRSVKEISELLGFSEPKYFGAVFKKQMGCSPLTYRHSGVKAVGGGSEKVKV